ncbi:MAG: thioredoxin domain-containing protein [Candidatus Saccharibacteria bacterium]|nr:thioredoxin domain-containing protein [Candidatus Saccharibacteria bacterium]
MFKKSEKSDRKSVPVWPFLIVGAIIVITVLVIWAYNDKMAYKKSGEALGPVAASEETGNLEENVYYGVDENGKLLTKETANPELYVFEYADYQCPHCGTTFPFMSSLIDEYHGRVALVFRTFIMSYHQHGNAATKAVNAAGMQGYWHEMAMVLFEKQSEWAITEGNAGAITAATFSKKLDEYFKEASNGKGDLDKFHEDMKTEAVQKKIEYDLSIVHKLGIKGTPTFYIDGKDTNFTSVEENGFKDTFRKAIDKALSK